MDELLKIKNKYPVVKEIRGMGLMIGMEFNEPVAEKIVIDALGDKLVLNRVSDTILRFLPPLVITRENIDTLTGWLDAEIKELFFNFERLFRR
jgi:acetylornithine/N-succinyldiaminopimelate aminotransferase